MTSLTTILRNRVKVWKSKDYIKYLKERFPGQDLHHLLGSFTSCKITDSLIVPLSREAHGRVHKMTKDECLETYLATAINLLQEYITRLEHENG